MYKIRPSSGERGVFVILEVITEKGEEEMTIIGVGIQTAALLVTLWISSRHPARNKRQLFV